MGIISHNASQLYEENRKVPKIGQISPLTHLQQSKGGAYRTYLCFHILILISSYDI